MKTVMLVDSNHLIHRHHHSTNLTDGEGHATGGLFGVLYGVHQLITEYTPDAVIAVWDSGLDPWRRSILPTYKDRTDKNPEKEKERKLTKSQIGWQVEQLVEHVLPIAGVPSVRLKGCEADDIIYLIRNRICPNYRAIVVSGDKDFLQMINPSTWVFDPMGLNGKKRTGMMVTLENFKVMTGLENPQQFLDYRSIVGDSSDKIPGVRGVGPITAENLLWSYNSIIGMLDQKEKIRKMGVRFAAVVSKDGIATIVRNRKLISLAQRPEPAGEVDAIKAAMACPDLRLDIKALEQYAISKEAFHFADLVPSWSRAMREQLNRFKSFTF